MNIFNKKLLICFLFLIVIVLFFFNVIFGNKTLLSYGGPDMYPQKYVSQPYLTNTVQDEFAPSWIDVPYSALVHSFFKKYELPLWNQYSAIGYPLAADMESSAFFPLHFPSLFGLKSWDFFLIFRSIVAMVFLYLFLREIKLKTIPAVLGSFLYSFSGYFIYYINNFILNVDMLLPAGLFFVTRLFKKKTVLNFLLCVITFFLILNGSNPQPSLLGLIFINGYFLYLILIGKENVQKKISLILNCLLINLIGFGLSAFNYSLFLELYRNAWTIHPNGLASIHMQKIALSNFIFPYLIGYLKGVIINNIRITRIIPYFGILATWLALVGLGTHKHKRNLLFFFTIFCLWFLKLIGFPFFEPLLKLPFVTNIWFNKYVGTLFLSSSILTAIGVDTLIDIFENSRFKTNRDYLYPVYCLLIPLIFFISLQITGNYLGLYTGIKDFLPGFIDNNFIITHASNYRMIGSAFFKWERMFVILALIFSLLLVIRPFRKHLKKFVFTISLFLFFSVVAETYLYFPKIRSDKFDPAQKFPFVDFLKRDKDLFRIYGTEQTVMPQENLFFGINDIRIVSPLLYSRYASFFRELLINQPKEDYGNYLVSKEDTMNNVNNNLLSLLNVKYVISNIPLTSTDSNYSLIYDDDVKIYLNKKVLPRVFLADRIIPGLNQKQIFSYLKSQSFLPFKEAVVENATAAMIEQTGDNHKNGTDSTATINQYDSDYVNIKVLSSGKKLLVLSDLNYPGWQVYIDGKEDKIYATNYVMRGVYIPKGSHTVEFIYSPKSFRIGIIISLFTIGFTFMIIKFKLIKPLNA